MSQFLKNVFCGYRILGQQLCFSALWRYHSRIFWLPVFLLRSQCQFSRDSIEGNLFLFVFVLGFQQTYYDLSVCGLSFIPVLGSQSFQNLWLDIFYQFQKTPSHGFFKYCFSSILSVIPFGDHNCTYSRLASHHLYSLSLLFLLYSLLYFYLFLFMLPSESFSFSNQHFSNFNVFEITHGLF